MTSRLTFVRATAVATVMLAPIALTACGSKDDEAAASSTAAATSTTTTTATAAATTSEAPATTEAPSSEEAKPEEAKPEENTPAPEAPAAPEQQEAPPVPVPAGLDPNTIPVVEPITGGQPGTPEDIAQIRGVMENLNSGKTTHQVLNSLKANTCSRVLNAEGNQALDVNQIPDVPVTMLPDYQPSTIGDITDVVVDGDELSAQVSTTTGGETRTGTIRMAREGGQWKLCD